jgi:hypothetical protein
MMLLSEELSMLLSRSPTPLPKKLNGDKNPYVQV